MLLFCRPVDRFTKTNNRGARVQIFKVVDTSCYFWLSCILLNFNPSRIIFQRATLSNRKLAQRGSWNVAPKLLQGHLLATRNLYTIV